MARQLEIRIDENTPFTLDVKKTQVGEFAAAFIDYAMKQVGEKGAEAKSLEDVAESFLGVLSTRIDFVMADLDQAGKDTLLEWLLSVVIGGYGQDFFRRYVATVSGAAPPQEEPSE